MKVVDRNELITLIRRKGGRASSSMSDAALASEANRLGMGAKKMGSNPGKRRRRSTSERGGPSLIPGAKRGTVEPHDLFMPPDPRTPGLRGAQVRILGPYSSGEWWIHDELGNRQGPYPTKLAAQQALYGPWVGKKKKKRGNPGPDPYRKDVLVMTPGGVSYTGPYGPFGSREWQPGLRGNPVGAMDDYLLIAPPAPAPTASNPSIEHFGGFRRGDRVTVGARSGRKGWSGIIYQFVPYGGYGFGDQPVVIVERTSDRSMQHVPMEWLKKTRTRGHRNPPMGDYLQIAGNPVGDYLQINPGLPRPGEIVPGRAGRRGRNPRAKNSPFHKGDEVFVPSGHRGVVAGAAPGGKVKVRLARGGTMTFAASSLVHCDPSCHTHGMF
ncbi:MAG: hypothetical protein IT371_30580 [Deltaproteobacteria bacterium]|nr:hypothetical protein [Deltaproteobacteria bacterium]